MKKVILLVVILLAYGCESDNIEQEQPIQKTCNCDKVFEYKEINHITNAQTDWILVANAYPNFTTDCTQNEKVSNQQSTGNGTITRITRHRIICR